MIAPAWRKGDGDAESTDVSRGDADAVGVHGRGRGFWHELRWL